MKKIAILGFGREGQSTYKFLGRHPVYKKAEFWILDADAKTKTPTGAKKQLGKNYLNNLSRFDLVFRSPGIPYNKLVNNQWSLVTKLTSPTRLFFELCPCPIIGITGTKGKGTTATLLYNILKNCGRDAFLAGNIGLPALNILPKLKKDSLVILELSSFQLQDLKKSPAVGIVLDIFPDHLDHHKNFKEYVSAKANIASHQNKKNAVFYFSDDKYSSQIAKKSRGIKKSIYHSITAKERNALRKVARIPGNHNWRNIQAAFAVAKHLKCPEKKILEAVKKFKGNEHRLELVRPGFYNDSASTNPQTTLAAVRAFKEPKILIAGGSDKGLDYKIWAKEFPKINVKAVILFGENKIKIQKILKKSIRQLADKIQMSNTLDEAVKIAASLIKPNWILLFSPGAASFDMFKDYAERGERFKKIVKKLKI